MWNECLEVLNPYETSKEKHTSLGSLDLDTKFEYLIVYKNKRDNTINTWTLGIGFKNNYKAMMNDDNVKILGVYKKLTDAQLENIITT